MKYKRRILEVLLRDVQVETTGKRGRGEKHLIAATLVHPRPSIVEKSAVRAVALENGIAALSKEGWSDRILFKEVVQGPTAIRVEVSEAVSDSEMAKLGSIVADTALDFAEDSASELTQSIWLGGMIGVSLEYLGKALSSKDGPRCIGSGIVELCADDKWKAGAARKMKIPLVAERGVDVVERRRRQGKMSTRRKSLLKAGEPNGFVTLALRTYD